jgi:nucleoside-diphosphate-sugar epimerase
MQLCPAPSRRIPHALESDLRVLVTGANGFIGRHVCAALHDAGHTVVGLVRPGPARRVLPNVLVAQGDITVRRSLEKPLNGCDAVVHLAGAKQAVRESTYSRVNTRGSVKLAKAAERAGVARVVFISTIAAQGPARRGYPHVSAGSEAPLNAYGRSKLSAEQHMREILGDALIILRPSLVYGADDPHLLAWARMVRRRIVPMVGQLELSMLHVEDLARATLSALTADATREPLFLSDGVPVRFETLIDRIESLVAEGPVMRIPLPSEFLSRWVPIAEAFGRVTGLGALAGRRLGELTARAWTCDPQRARACLGFAPLQTQVEGVPAAIRAMQAAGELPHRAETFTE